MSHRLARPRAAARLTAWALLACLGGCSPAAPSEPPPAAPTPSAAAREEPPAAAAWSNTGGMWLPEQLKRAEHRRALEQLGLELDPERLADPSQEPLSAIVFLGGCSASFVSPDGLIITNHHCVTGALQHSSTPDNNLVENGFLAQTRDQELSNGPAARVYVTLGSRDVTQEVRDGLEREPDAKARHVLVERRISTLVGACEKDRPDVRCQVSQFYGGATYLLVERLTLRDIRLVHAPHKGVGNFGGEVDNWRWPRHTGDYGMYRAYVGKDGKPANFSKDNIPYRPRAWLRVAEKPLGPGDLVWVAGYPAQTNRLDSAFEVAEDVEWSIPRTIELADHYLPVLERVGKTDAEAKIKGTPLERGLANVRTYMQGALEGLTQGGALAQKRELDRRLEQWIAADPQRTARYGQVFERLRSVYDGVRASRELDANLRELERLTTLLNAARGIVKQAEERPKPDAEREPGYQERDWEQQTQALQDLGKRYDRELELGLLSEALMRAAALPEASQPKLLRQLVPNGQLERAAIERALKTVYARTRLEDATTRVRLYTKASSAELQRSPDPLIQLALKLHADLEARDDRRDALAGELLLLKPLYLEALRELTPGEIAPDANRTLRITYGTVKGYRPKPGAQVYHPFTKLSGMQAKITDQEPFAAPPALLQALDQKQRDPYTSPAAGGEVPVNFLADLDITGGNSGSATLDARGQLVGLAFDGNYEAMASDWLFMPEITRSIHVDIRYVLWLLDAVFDADHLLREMGVEPKLPRAAD